MAGNGGYSIGVSWVGDVLRRLVGARGRWIPPDRYAPFVQSVAEIRPHFEWEFFQARWTKGSVFINVAAVAGQFGVADFSNPLNSGRYVLFRNFQVTAGAVSTSLYVNRALINPTKGAGIWDSRNRSNTGSWLTPMLAGIAAGSAAGLPPIADNIWRMSATNLLCPVHVFLAPGQTVSWFASPVNTAFDIQAEAWEIPADDVDG